MAQAFSIRTAGVRASPSCPMPTRAAEKPCFEKPPLKTPQNTPSTSDASSPAFSSAGAVTSAISVSTSG